MSLTVVGSIAYDAVKTPFGARERMLGGAATHFALAASFFDEVRVIGPVGEDFDDASMATLCARAARSPTTSSASPAARPSSGAASTTTGSTRRETHDTELNVFEHFEPKLSAAGAGLRRPVPREHPAGPPARACASSATRARFVAMDSMDLWINIARDSLVRDDRGASTA